MKYTKKLLSLVLVLVLALAMAIPGFAGNKTYTLTINDETEGHTYEAYQVFSGDYDAGKNNLSNVQWGSGVKGAELLAALKSADNGTYGECSSAADVAAKLTEGNVKAFVDVVAGYLTETKVPFNYVEAVEDGAAAHYAANLNEGYYFVKQIGEVGTDEAFSDFIVKLVGDTSVDPKSNDVPDPGKTVGEGTGANHGSYNIGDDVPFTLTATLPDAKTFDEYKTYYLKFTDTLSNGLTYNGDAKVYLGDKDITAQCEITPTEAGGQNLTVEINDVKAEAIGASAGNVISVKYTAELNANAVIGGDGNKNEVTLEYSNDPNNTGTGDSTKEEVYVYTFKMDGLKYDGEKGTGTGLANAWFTLQNSENEYAVIDTESGKVTGWQDEKPTHGDSIPGNIKSGANGKFVVTGLAEGTYTLTETVAPAGYNLLEEPITIKVEATYGADGKITGMTVTMDTDTPVSSDKGTGIFAPEIANFSGATLPSTGGMGTTIFYTLGGVLVVGAAILLVTKKRVHDVEG